ncbi:MAG: methyltransferase domain-containing protein [Actinomycetota bacterium]
MDYTNFERHYQYLTSQIYTEPYSAHHAQTAKEMVQYFCYHLDFLSAVEFGCGTAPCLDEMKKMGKKTLGVTLGGEKLDHEVLREDMHFTSLPDGSFEMAVVRHALEHSPMPLILLLEIRRIATKFVLIAVPSPTEFCIRHKNHYSVFHRINWEYLFKLSGWKVKDYRQIRFFCEDWEKDDWMMEYQYLLETK